MKAALVRYGSGVLLAGTLSLALPSVLAQKAIAVPQLDLNKITGTWYEIAKLPNKPEKKCLSDGTVLYALNDKRMSFQRGIFCTIKGGDRNNINDSGTQDKQADGKLRLRHLVIFHRPSWVLATAPNFAWALVGNPNHKELWVLSRQPTLDDDVYTRIQGVAAAQGFPVAKLVLVPHPKDRVTLASPSANPATITTTGSNPAATPAATAPASPSTSPQP